MAVGEGIGLAALVCAAAIAGIGMTLGAVKVARQWSKAVDGWPIDDADHDRDDRIDPAMDAIYRENIAKALVPGYAAEALARARVRDGCGCASCRARFELEPCSDYSGD